MLDSDCFCISLCKLRLGLARLYLTQYRTYNLPLKPHYKFDITRSYSQGIRLHCQYPQVQAFLSAYWVSSVATVTTLWPNNQGIAVR